MWDLWLQHRASLKVWTMDANCLIQRGMMRPSGLPIPGHSITTAWIQPRSFNNWKSHSRSSWRNISLLLKIKTTRTSLGSKSSALSTALQWRPWYCLQPWPRPHSELVVGSCGRRIMSTVLKPRPVKTTERVILPTKAGKNLRNDKSACFQAENIKGFKYLKTKESNARNCFA